MHKELTSGKIQTCVTISTDFYREDAHGRDCEHINNTMGPTNKRLFINNFFRKICKIRRNQKAGGKKVVSPRGTIHTVQRHGSEYRSCTLRHVNCAAVGSRHVPECGLLYALICATLRF